MGFHNLEEYATTKKTTMSKNLEERVYWILHLRFSFTILFRFNNLKKMRTCKWKNVLQIEVIGEQLEFIFLMWDYEEVKTENR